MDAVSHLGLREQPWRDARRVPAVRDRNDAEAHAQIARHDLHDLRLSAVAVEQDELPHPGAGDQLADLGPEPGERPGRQAERAREGEMLVALADRQQRQDRDRQLFGHQLERTRDDSLIDAGVDHDRKVRTVLLDRADRQQRDDPPRIQPCELGGGHVLPEAPRQSGHDPLPLRWSTQPS